MSEAQFLSAKQQRRTLSNAKKKKKAPIRNVYGHPRNDYWPVLCPEDESIVLNLLRKLLPAHRNACKLNKNDLASDSTTGHLTSSHIGDHRDEVVVGLRKVVVEIESGNLKCLLLTNKVDPPSLGFILGNAATAHNIPFVTISNLKNTIEELLGFKSWCVGFLASSKHFDPIFDKIKSILPSLQPTKSQEEMSFTMENNCKSNCGVLEGKAKNVTELYFYRSDKSKRMFVPESCSGSSENSSKDLFLSFSKDSSDDVIYQKVIPTNFKNSGLINKLNNDSKERKQYPRYFEKIQLLPLQVKRFQVNPNKQKWKKSKNRSENI